MDSIERNKVVIILGMHRSGTSCLAGSLQDNGLFLGDVITRSPFNLKGNRENLQIMTINDNILKFNNGSWDHLPLQINWNQDLAISRDKLIDTYERQGSFPWGFKDPRTIFTLPFWMERLPEPIFIATYRNPSSVSVSLSKRNGMSIEKALNLWKIYNEKLLQLYDRYNFPIVSFDVSKEHYLAVISKVSDIIGLSTTKEKGNNIFFDEDLRNPENVAIDLSNYNEINNIHSRLKSIHESQFSY